MGVPFFYLNCGTIQIFQAQNNKTTEIKKTLNADMTIHISGYTDISTGRLYLNGIDSTKRYNFVKNIRSVHNLKKLINDLKLIQGDY